MRFAIQTLSVESGHSGLPVVPRSILFAMFAVVLPGCVGDGPGDSDGGDGGGDTAGLGTDGATAVVCPESACKTSVECGLFGYCEVGPDGCGVCRFTSVDDDDDGLTAPTGNVGESGDTGETGETSDCTNECVIDSDCGDGRYCQQAINDFKCSVCVQSYCECSPGGQCLANEDCTGEGEYCELPDPDPCDCGSCAKICTADSDCKDPAKPICNRVTGICVGDILCTSDSQCTAPEVCAVDADGLPADCGPRPSATVAACRLLGGAETLAIGGRVTVSAIALAADGKAVARALFTWTSSNATVLVAGTPTAPTPTIQGTTAQFTAKAPGVASITASYDNGTGAAPIACTGSAAITVIAPPEGPTGYAVVVLDALDGTPISGAAVSIETGLPATATPAATGRTGGDGIVQLDAPTAKALHITAPGFDAVSLMAAPPRVTRVFLDRAVTATAQATVTGTFDFLEGREGDITLGLAGLSAGGGNGSILDLSLSAILGSSTAVPLDCSSLGFNDSVGLPKGLVLELPADLCIGGRATFTAVGQPGPRVLWGFGGKLSLNDVLPIVLDFAGVISGGSTEGLPIGQILAKVFPFFGQFDHGLDLDRTLTSGDEITGAKLPLTSRLSIGAIVKAPALPRLGTGFADAALALGGVTDRMWGLIPLGIGIGVDKPDPTSTDPADGVITPDEAQIGLKEGDLGAFFTRAHSGLEERGGYTFLVLAAPTSSLLGGGAASRAGVVKRLATIPTLIDFSGETFPAFLEGTTWDPATRTGTLGAGATKASEPETYRRVVLTGAAGRRLVYLPPGVASFTLPTEPESLDFTSKAAVLADRVVLAQATLIDLFDAAGAVSTRELDDLLTGFSSWVTPAPAASATPVTTP
jgi:hypothetical protein